MTVRVTPVLTFLTRRTEGVGSNLPWAAPPARLKKNLKTMKRKKPGVSGPNTECHSSATVASLLRGSGNMQMIRVNESPDDQGNNAREAGGE